MEKINKQLYDTQTAGALYSFAIILLFLLSFFFSAALLLSGVEIDVNGAKPDWYLYCNYLVPQIAFALVIAAVFIFVKVTPKEVFKSTKWQYFLLAILLQFGLFSLSWVNGYFLRFLQDALGYQLNQAQLPSLEQGGLFFVIIVVALLPAIFEESIFRGLLLAPMKKLSTPVAVLLNGFLFALYHQNPAQTLYQFVCGCAFALIAIRANSVLPTILSHFLNNTAIILLTYFGIDDFTGMGGVIFYILAAISLAATLVWLIFIDRKTNEKKSQSVQPFLLFASVGIAVCAVSWITNLFLSIG